MFRLADPWLLALLLPAVAAAWLLARRRRRGDARLVLPGAAARLRIGRSPWQQIERGLPWLRGLALMLVELALVAVGTSVMLEAAFELFGRATSHRGLVHSLPAGAAFGLGTAMVAHRVLGADPVESWLYATFLCLGFVAHLILDEIYAVDVMGASLKQSFGSALSLGDRGNILGTGALYLAVALLLQACPPADGFLTIASDAATYRAVVDRILPEGSWFT